MNAFKARHIVQRTVLLVGEGDAEIAFVRHLKSLYVARGSGVAVTLKNARGKSALSVVQVAINQSRNADFDVKAALLDTDTGWDEKTQKVARKAKVKVLLCIPCLEAMLIGVHGDIQQSQSSNNLKRIFETRFGAPAHDASLYPKHFSKELLEKARLKSAVLEELLTLLTSP
jgi:hypothetical protein